MNGYLEMSSTAITLIRHGLFVFNTNQSQKNAQPFIAHSITNGTVRRPELGQKFPVAPRNAADDLVSKVGLAGRHRVFRFANSGRTQLAIGIRLLLRLSR